MKILIVFIIIATNVFSQVRLWGHRGASSLAPENTMSSFVKVFEVGGYGIEMDLWSTKDDSVIVIHDGTLDRTTNGKGKVEEVPYDSIKNLDAGSWFSPNFKDERVPLFSEVLSRFSDKILMPEIKGKKQNLFRQVYNLISKYNMINKTIVQCFNSNILDSLKKIDKNLKVLYLVGDLDSNVINKAFSNKYEYIGASNNIEKKLVDYAQSLNIKIVAWTKNNIGEIYELISKNVYDIITDYPQYSSYFTTIESSEENNPHVQFQLINNDELIFYIKNLFQDDLYLQIYNILGQKIFSEHITNLQVNSNINIRLPKLASGVYLTLLFGKNIILREKFIILK